MSFLRNQSGIYWIVENDKKRQKYLQRLGRISKEDAKVKLDEWKKRLEIKDIYRTIVIDPPWPMEKIKRDVAPNQVGFDYTTMSIDEIKAFPLKKFMNKGGCHVYMWTTQKFLKDSFEIFKNWGVNYIFTMVWHKPGGFQPFGLAQYNCEFVLFGKVETLAFTDLKAFPACFNADRGKHSEKPVEFYELVDRVSPSPKIDIFNRRKHTGFDQYGYEADING